MKEVERLTRGKKAAGKIVICYFNGGAFQSWDKDTFGNENWPTGTIGKRLEGYDNGEDNYEAYLDIRNAQVVANMKARMTRAAKEAKCDGVDPDNIDAYIVTPPSLSITFHHLSPPMRRPKETNSPNSGRQ